MARGFDKGVQYYTHGTVEIPFPEDQVCCRWCPLMRADAGGARHLCVVTGLILADIDSRPDECPVTVNKAKEDV